MEQTTRRTQAQNRDAHPGLVDLPAPRRKPGELKREKELLQQKRAQEKEEREVKIHELRRIEQEQAAAQAAACATPTAPTAKPAKATQKAGKAKPHRKTTKPANTGLDDPEGEVDAPAAPPVFSGTKRARANLSVDLTPWVCSINWNKYKY